METHPSNDAVSLGAVGHVRVVHHSKDGSKVLYDDHNTVVDLAPEIMIQALMGDERISGIEFGYAKGRPVTRGLRTVLSPVGHAPTGATAETRPFASRDNAGLRTIGTWVAILSPDADITYDMMGLVSTANRTFAVTSFPKVTLPAGDQIEVEWTIRLRGNA